MTSLHGNAVTFAGRSKITIEYTGGTYRHQSPTTGANYWTMAINKACNGNCSDIVGAVVTSSLIALMSAFVNTVVTKHEVT